MAKTAPSALIIPTDNMKKSLLISAVSLAAICQANAAVYFFSPEGSGSKDGSTWENTLPADKLAETVKALNEGDMVCLRGGTYAPGLLTVPMGVTIKGGYSDSYDGTITGISYPNYTETILTADNDGDGTGDNGAAAFITMNFDGDAADCPLTLLAGLTIRDANYTGKTAYKGSAFFGANVNVEFDHLKFIGNKLSVGGGVTVLTGSEAYIHDCIWRNNSGTNAGVTLHIRQKGGGTTAGPAGSNIIVDRCEFSDNTVTKTDAQYGGVLALSDNAGTMIMANSTITGSQIKAIGAGIRAGTNTTFYSIHNTWFNNTCTWSTRYNGEHISIGSGAKFYSMADIVVNETAGKADNGTNSFAQVWIQATTSKFISGGYNLYATLTDNSNSGIAETDNVDMNHTVASVFGENEYALSGIHTQAIAPVESFRTVPLADVKAKAAEWKLPAQIDLGLDQTGAIRPELTLPGAHDPKGILVTGIDAATAVSTFAVRHLGAGRFSISGASGNATVYDLCGRMVGASTVAEGDVIDLSALPHGIYILAIDGKTAKLAN